MISFKDSIVVRVLACYDGDQGSIPSQERFFVTKSSLENRKWRSGASIPVLLTYSASALSLQLHRNDINGS